jgi:hypothetical protein
MLDRESDEKLFLRLSRAVMAVKTAKPLDDRRRLLALENDVRSLRAILHARCRLLVEKMNAAGAQLSAISAYARCASLRSEPPRIGKNDNVNNSKAME